MTWLAQRMAADNESPGWPEGRLLLLFLSMVAPAETVGEALAREPETLGFEW